MPYFQDWLGQQTRRQPSTLGRLALDVTQRDHCMPRGSREPFQHLYVLTHICQVHGADEVFIGAFLRAVREWSQACTRALGAGGVQVGAGFGTRLYTHTHRESVQMVLPVAPHLHPEHETGGAGR